MEKRRVVRGLVLRETDTKESDKILTVLTDSMGKIPVVAKGARSRRSKYTAAAQLLAYSELTLSESHGWQYLTEAATIELFDPVRRDVELLSLASYFAELTESVAYEESEAAEILSLLLNALYALGNLGKPQELVKGAFELRLLALIGFEPMLDRCACCGRTDPVEPVLETGAGVVRCRACPGGGAVTPLSPGALAAARYVLRAPGKRLFSFTLASEDLRRFSRAGEAYVSAMLEREFPTLGFYKSLKPIQNG
jgi:DNA repair protein RecO (recombination protein O)